MKLAVVTNDGRTISAHFGRARSYLVLTVANATVMTREMRDKTACDHGHHEHGHHHTHEHAHEEQASNVTLTDAAPAATPVRDSHTTAASAIADCEVVFSRGMGRGMYTNLQQAGVRPVLTDIVQIEEALAAYLQGRLQEQPHLVH